MARKKKSFDNTIADLDLVPIMNLVVCLIPMVLWGASMVKLGVVNINAPKFGMGAAAEPVDEENKPLNLTIGVASDGFRLSATGADLNQVLGLQPAVAIDPAAPEGAPTAGPIIPKKGDQYDYPALYNMMVAIKTRFPEETIVNLTAEPTLPYKHIITVMDAIRMRLDGDSYADLDAFRKGGIKMENGAQQLLWPDVVLAIAQ